MRRPLLATLSIAFALLLPAFAPAQSAPAADPPPSGYRIAGRVVDAVTGAPVPRVTVNLLSRDYQGALKSTVTGQDGRFAFDNVPAGKHPLNASRRGYRSAYYDEHESFNSAIVTGPGLDTGNLEFHLAPEAILHGVVTDDAGDPVENAEVTLFHPAPAGDSGPRIQQAGSTRTDDTGAYEFASLTAGEYLIAVRAEPWYAQHRPIYAGGSSEPSPLDVAYPVTFYDSTTDEAAATPIKVETGNRVEADITLHAVPALHFRLPTSRQPGGNSFQLMEHIFGEPVPTASYGVSGSDGLMEIMGIAPGTYDAEFGNPPRHMVLNAASNQDVSLTSTTPTVAISGRLSLAGGGLLPSPLVVTLTSQDGRQRMSAEAQNGQFHFDGVLPGAFTLDAASQDAQLAIVSIASGSAVTPGARITVADRPLSLAVTVTSAQASIQGFARNHAGPAPGVMIVLVPADPRDFPALVRRDQSDTDGSFELRGVAPGVYAILAIQNGWGLDWQDRQVIARYLRGGVPVTVTEQSGPVLRLSQPIPVQPRSP